MKLRKSSIQFKFAPALLIILTLGSFAICQSVQGVVPPPDGGYPGFNTAEGQNALKNLSTGAGNTAVGWNSLFGDTTASFNTGVGAGTLLFNNGDQNTAVGGAALLSNTTGIDNTAVGVTALVSNTTGDFNTATGFNALASNTGGVSNNAFGAAALLSNTIGSNNTAIGVRALQKNTEGGSNVALGERALSENTTGIQNTALGVNALFSNTTSDFNTAVGVNALVSNTTGNENTAIGDSALHSNTQGTANVAVGDFALGSNTTGGNNTALGYNAGSLTTGDANVCIGWGVTGVAGESFTTRIANIGNTPLAAGATVLVDTVGGTKLGYLSSSRRNKDDIKLMDNASEAIYSLRPVSFRYKPEIEPTGVQQYGLIAENVEEVSPDLVVRDQEGKAATVRFEAINAMLLNEFLKEHRKVQELEKEMAALTVTVKEQAAEIQKVSAQLRIGGSTPQIVANNP